MKSANFFHLTTIGVLLCTAVANVQAAQVATDPGQELQQESEGQISVALPSDPNLRWEAYLEENGLIEGVNNRNGKTFFIAKGEARVGKALADKGFIKSRTVAYNRAILTAKSGMAESVGAELSSIRSLDLFEDGGELSPAMETVKTELSLMDKARTLTSLALDDQIKRYDASWDGTGKSKEEKLRKIAVQTEKYKENLRQNARLFLQGATPIFNAEGPSDVGYSVVTGVVWSVNMAKVAESMYNPSVTLQLGPKGTTIKQQVREMLDANPMALAATLGVRVWRNQKGERTVVSFAAESGKGSPTIAKQKSALRARAQMAQFVSESVVSEGGLSSNESIVSFDDETTDAFDEESFQQTITATSKTVTLNGAASVFTWTGKHPNSKQKMFVNVMAWSPTTADVAIDMEARSMADSERMDSVKRNAGGMTSGSKPAGGGVATGGLSGPQSTPDDF